MNIKAYEEVIDSNGEVSDAEIVTRVGAIAGVEVSVFGESALKNSNYFLEKLLQGRTYQVYMELQKRMLC